MTAERLLHDLRDGLAAQADPERAVGMQAYMKSTMPFRGVPTPPLTALCRRVFAAHPLPDEPTWRCTVLSLWCEARFREERYAATQLTGWPAYARFQTPAALPLYEHLVVDGAWWDHVDTVAIQRIGPILRQHPAELTPLMLRWAVDPDRWRRRTAIICQIGAKGAADRDLLHAAIEANLEDGDFFVRKAIGWALRQLASTHPDEVEAYVTALGPRISALSRREAMKNLPVIRQRTPVAAR